MSHQRYPLKSLAVWAFCGLALGAVAAGCGGTPPPTTTTDTSTSNNTPVAAVVTPVANQSQEPTAAVVAAARPKDLVDPFTKPSQRGPVAATATPTTIASGDATPKPTPKVKATPLATPTTPPTPPSPPTLVAVGIFASKHGPEAILAPKGASGPGGSGETLIVTTGTRLKEGGYVKSIDPVSRKVVIDKENTDFVLPLEAPSGPSPSTPGK